MEPYRLQEPDLRRALELLREVFQENPEPLPSWEEGDPALLEMCRSCTDVEAFGTRKYPDVPSAAAKLFYSAIKNHPFPNGNKRFALALTIYFIVFSEGELTAARAVSARVAEWVASTDPHDPQTSPDAVVRALTVFFEQSIEPAPDDEEDQDESDSN
jgi:prophage maintenance system killer protein